MAQSVKIADDVMRVVRQESELQSRSIAGQIAHWVRLARAIERSGYYDHAKISAALSGDLETAALTGEEKQVWAEEFAHLMAEPAAAEKAFFENRARLGQGVGLDASGNLVFATQGNDAAE